MIAADTIPVYNYSHLANFGLDNGAIWTDTLRGIPVWTCTDWIEWFNALNTKYGEAKAKEIWKYFWAAGVSTIGGGLGMVQAGSGVAYDSVPLDCRTFNTEFRDFIDTYGLIDSVYTGIGSITKPIGFAVSGVNDIANGVSGITGAIANVGKILKWLIPAVLITVTILMIIKINRGQDLRFWKKSK